MSDTQHRELELNSFDEVLDEIDRLAEGQATTTGSFTFAQIVDHLATANDLVTGRIKPPKLPWMLRLLMPFMRNKVLNSRPTPGFKLPSAEMQNFFWKSGEVDLQQAIARFRETVDYYKTNGPLPVHPIFGPASRKQIDRLMIQHASMHLGFVHPA